MDDRNYRLLPEAIRKFNLYQDLFNDTTLNDIDYVNEVGMLSIKYEKSLKNIEKMVFECGNRLIERNMEEELYRSRLAKKYKVIK